MGRLQSIGLLIFLFWLNVGCGNQKEDTPYVPHTSKTTVSNHFECKTIAVDGGWGYTIYVDGALYVKQEHIPAIQGVFPFQSESDAFQVGSLAMQKLEQGIMPPTVTAEEMMNLGVVLPAQN